MSLSESVKLLLENEKEVIVDCSEILIKLSGKIIGNPENVQYKKIRIGNPTFMKRILPVDGAMQCLFEMGFEEAEEFVIFPQNGSIANLRKMNEELQRERTKILQSHVKQNELSAAAGPSTSETPALPSNSTPTLPTGLQLFQSEANFFKKLETNLNHVLLYEISTNQEKARQCIPIKDLEEKAKRKIDDMMKSGQNGLGVRDLFLLELLSWFKKDFFKWVNAPACVSCGGETRNVGMVQGSPEEIQYGAGRVENYICDRCKVHTRFPRYNDPVKLLETRSGRCGEWANCFTLCCRAVGFEARYVLDWTDHVWTEVYSEHLQRWLHCDPCENSCDKPLVYETGWNKKLSYIFAFSKDDIQDVTWRYSNQHSAVRLRRNQCRESWLVQTIIKLREKKQQSLGEARKKILLDRLLKELIEFLTLKTAGSDEQIGRISGSEAWRVARGEIETIPSGKGVIIKPTPQECENKLLHMTYCCSEDVYRRPASQGEEVVNGWHNMVHQAENISRKEEQDWNMVYLARMEGTSQASISWRIDLEGSGLVVDRIEILADSRCYEDGHISWRICAGDECAMLPPDGRHTVIDNLRGSVTLTLTAVLTKGKGNVAWQHTQLFRQSSDDKHLPLDLKIFLHKL